MDQKRVYKRIEDLIEVEFVSDSQGVTTIIRTRTRDISAGGIKVFLNRRMDIGEKMQLSILLPKDSAPIKTEAQVISSDLIGVVGDKGEETLYETRFKFGRAAPEEKNRIIAYVFECRKKSLDAKYGQDE